MTHRIFLLYFLFTEKKVTKKAAQKSNLLDLLSHMPTLPGPKSSGFAHFWGCLRAAKEQTFFIKFQ
jgi:hypothetical protein